MWIKMDQVKKRETSLCCLYVSHNTTFGKNVHCNLLVERMLIMVYIAISSEITCMSNTLYQWISSNQLLQIYFSLFFTVYSPRLMISRFIAQSLNLYPDDSPIDLLNL